MLNRVAIKAVGDSTDFGIDWTSVLKAISAGEWIDASMWAIQSGDIIANLSETEEDGLNGQEHDNYHATIWCRGGTPGTVSILKNTISTNHGRVLQDTVTIEVADILDRTIASRYTSLLEIENQFGRQNVLQWAKIEEEDVPAINSRFMMHMVNADELVDSYLLGGVYRIPFLEPIPGPVRQAASLLAGVLIYEARGIIDVNSITEQPMHRLSFCKKRAELTLRRIRNGRQRLAGINMFVKTTPSYEEEIVRPCFIESLLFQ